MTDKEFLNLPVGSTFILGNKTLKVVEDVECDECYISGDCDMYCEKVIIPKCSACDREDETDVIFVEMKDESME